MFAPSVAIGDRRIGEGSPTFIVAEIGINHNGDLGIAKSLIDAAIAAGCDGVKFQKRTPDLCVPLAQRDTMRETPWGYMSYIEYRYRVELGPSDYVEIDRYCRRRGIMWFASCWDEEAVDFMEQFDPPCYKIQSAAVADHPLLWRLRQTGAPLVLSTGMSTMDEIRAAVELLTGRQLVICHSTSSYPCETEELNLRMIVSLAREFDAPVGYSGHEVGLPTTIAAVALGATYVERHITLDRAMWGSDQAASIEPRGFERLVKYIRTVEQSMGDGVKRIYHTEMIARQKLCRVQAAPTPLESPVSV